MTVQNGRCRDGGLEDAAGRCHRTSVILDITKREVKGTHGRGGTVERMVAGRRMGGCGGTMPRMDNLKW